MRYKHVALLMVALLACAIAAKAETYTVSTEGGTLNARTTPDGNVEYEIDAGEALEVARIENGWAEVTYCGDVLYASAAYLTRSDKPVGVYQVRSNGRVRVRDTPGGKKLGYVEPGDEVMVTHWGTDDAGAAWGCIGGGYVCADYLEEAEHGTEATPAH